MGIALSGLPLSLPFLGSMRMIMPRGRRSPSCLLLLLHLLTGPERRVLVLWALRRKARHRRSEPGPKILERSGPLNSPLHPRADINHTNTNMDTGCPSLLMLPPHPHPRRKRACLARTPASHLANGVGKATALMNVAEVTAVLRETARSIGVTALPGGMALHPPRGTDTIETLHPGGEIKTSNDNEGRNPLDLFSGALYFFLLASHGRTFRISCTLRCFISMGV